MTLRGLAPAIVILCLTLSSACKAQLFSNENSEPAMVQGNLLMNDYRPNQDQGNQGGMALEAAFLTPSLNNGDVSNFLNPRLRVGVLATNRTSPGVVGYVDITSDIFFARKTRKNRPYMQTAFGLAVHDGVQLQSTSSDKVLDAFEEGIRYLGSPFQFHESIEFGYDFNGKRLGLTWSHISHARMFHPEYNGGVSWVGVRFGYSF